MKKLLLLFALVLTVCGTAMAQSEDLASESAVGTIGTLNGREAMVVDLGGSIGKVAVATRNVGAEKVADKWVSTTFGTSFKLGDANDPEKNGLTDGWYVPSKAEMEALKKNVTPNKGLHCVEWKVTDNATLYLPTWHSSSSTPYYGYYVTSDRVKEDDTWKCWIYFFNFYDSDNTFGGNYFEKDDEQITEGCAIRPFHKLPIPKNEIWYTSSNGQIVVPNAENAFGGAKIVSNEYDEGKGKGCITFDRELTSIGLRAFNKCTDLTSVTIPSSVTGIGSWAFYQCTDLTSVTLPGSLEKIEDSAFRSCEKLASITLPQGLESIRPAAFMSCENLASINIPGKLTSIGSNAFADCVSLSSISVDEGNTIYESPNNCNAIIETATNTLIAGCKNTVIPSSVTTIGNGAFNGHSNLTSITIPSTVTCIETSAFANCTGLTSITLPDGLETIKEVAFANSGLRKVELPSTMTSIGNQAFTNCKDLIAVVFKGTEPPTAGLEDGSSPFPGAGSIIGGSVLLVPEGSVNKYVEAGYPNVYSMADNWAMQVINTLMNGMTTFSDEELLTIEAGKTKINEATDFATVYDEFIKAISIINLRKAKDADIAQLDNITASLTDKEKATLQAAIDDCKAQINSAKDIVTADKELELTKTKIESIVSLYNLNYNTLTQAEIDDIASRILAATDKDTVISEVNAFMYTERELAKQMLPNISHGENLLRDYLARIDNSLSPSEIKSIVQEAWDYIDSIPKMAIGDISYLLEELTISDAGIVYNALTDIQLTDAAAIKMPSDTYQIQCLSTTIHYSRTLPEGVWQCWYEPFQTKVNTEKFDAAEIAGILYNDKNEPIVCFRKMANGDMMLPNTIYVIRAKEGCSVLNLDPLLLTTLYGKQLTMQSAFDNYVLGGYYGVQPLPFANKEDETHYGKDWYTLNDKGQFSLRKATDTLKPQRFWLSVTPRTGSNGYYPIKDTSEAKEFIDFTVLGDEETTGIEEASPKSSPASAELSTGSGKGVIYDLMGRKVTSIQKGRIYIVNGKKFIAR